MVKSINFLDVNNFNKIECPNGYLTCLYYAVGTGDNFYYFISGYKYILVFTEYLTKWVDAYAVKNKEAHTILNCFVQFVCAHGVPEELITDQGREFCN